MINSKRLRIVTALLLLLVISCRSSDADEQVIKGGVAAIKIDFNGAEYEDNPSVKKLDAQKKIVLVDPSTLLEIEMTTNTTATRTSISESLKDQSKIRIIAYDKASGNYKTHKDYFLSGGLLQVIGGGNPALMLDGGISYTIVTYSFGTKELPVLTNGEQTNINTAKINYNYASVQDFMYEIQNITPVGGENNILKILLKHKVAEITTKLRTTPYADIPIEKITKASLSPHYTMGTISLLNGSIINNGTLSAVTVPFNDPASPIRIASPVLVNANANGTGEFKADITIDGVTKTINTGPVFSITPGIRKNLNISIAIKCGAYLGPNQTQWNDFMCHNLGADTSINPFIPNAAIHGARYQWGAQTNETGRYYSQSDDQVSNNAVTGWNSTPKADNSWLDASKTSNDPCPEGYKVPSADQWQKVIAYNKITYLGSNWSPNHYDNAVKYGDGLLLPTAGYRSAFTSVLYDRGLLGYYWSSTELTSPNSFYLFFAPNGAKLLNGSRNGGYSLRCIKE